MTQPDKLKKFERKVIEEEAFNALVEEYRREYRSVGEFRKSINECFEVGLSSPEWFFHSDWHSAGIFLNSAEIFFSHYPHHSRFPKAPSAELRFRLANIANEGRTCSPETFADISIYYFEEPLEFSEIVFNSDLSAEDYKAKYSDLITYHANLLLSLEEKGSYGHKINVIDSHEQGLIGLLKNSYKYCERLGRLMYRVPGISCNYTDQVLIMRDSEDLREENDEYGLHGPIGDSTDFTNKYENPCYWKRRMLQTGLRELRPDGVILVPYINEGLPSGFTHFENNGDCDI